MAGELRVTMAELAHERLKESIEEWDLAQCQSQTEIYQSNPKTTARVDSCAIQPPAGSRSFAQTNTDSNDRGSYVSHGRSVIPHKFYTL